MSKLVMSGYKRRVIKWAARWFRKLHARDPKVLSKLDHEDGVCNNFYIAMHRKFGEYKVSIPELDFLVDNDDWEYFSGHPGYPVPSTNEEYDAEEMYKECEQMFNPETAYGMMRYEYVLFCAKQIEQLLEDE